MWPFQGATLSGTLMLVILAVAGHLLQDCQAWMTTTTTTTASWIYASTAPLRTTASRRTKQTTTVSCRMVAPQQLGMFEPLTLSTLPSSSSSSASSASSAALLMDVQEEIIQQEDRFVILEDLVSAPSTQSRDDTASSSDGVHGGGSNSDLWIPSLQQQQSRLVPFHQGWDIQKELSLEHRHRLDRLRLHHPSTGPTAAAAATRTRETSFSPFLDKNTATKWQELQQQQQQEQCSAAMPQPERDIFRGGLDTILFVQHEPVYTLGSGSDESLILNNHHNSDNNNDNNHVDNDEQKIPIVRMNRGGEVTYHGPGMLVVYPVLDLRNYRKDIHWYMRALEEAVLLALQDVGIQGAVRDEETTGVWIRSNDQDDNGELYKVAAIGIHCRQWITQHGLAINVEKNPISERAFAGIVPCGLHGRKVGCVNQFLDEKHAITVEQMATSMVASLEEVFRIKLVKRPL